jgi:hypothetical protein
MAAPMRGTASVYGDPGVLGQAMDNSFAEGVG